MNRIKILCLSIWYPLSISRYFEKAFRHREDVDLLTTGPYTGRWIPWMGGMDLLPKYALPPDIPLPFNPSVGRVNYEFVKAQLPKDWMPDLVISIDAGINWVNKPVDGLVATVATDAHVLDYTYQRQISDKFFNMQAFYSAPNDIYLPYAYSKYDHFPVDSVSKDTDAVLIGMPYDNRVKWVDALRKRGVSVIFENGPVFDEARELYARGRIGLDWSSMNDLNARVFELAAMKLFPVVNAVPDLFKFNFANYMKIFNTLDEAVEAVIWAKEHPDDAKKTAQRAYDAVLPETYDARVSQILKECGFA